MKVSELAQKLTDLIQLHGDMEVVGVVDSELGKRVFVDYSPIVESVEFPIDFGKTQGPYCGILMTRQVSKKEARRKQI